MSDTRESGNILKGVAILCVLINHYLNLYTDLKSGGFANIIVSIFFLLSGYGIFYSIENNGIFSKFSLGEFFVFFRNRFIKIFPIFWIALCIQMLVVGHFFPPLMFFGYHAEGHYWFISSIIQCYLFTPFLVVLLRYRYFTFIAISGFMLFVNFIIPQNHDIASIINFFHLSKAPYLGIDFLHTYIYFIGMCIRKFKLDSKAINEKIKSDSKREYFIFIFLLFIYAIYSVLEKFFLPLPVLGNITILISFSIYTLRSKIYSDNFIMKFLFFLGQASFPIYLFHMSYYFLLKKIWIFNEGYLFSMLLTVILLPAFIRFVYLIERRVNQLSQKTLLLTTAQNS